MTTKVADMKLFFWEYMQKDLRLAARSLNLNQDEIITLVHRICGDILSNKTAVQSNDSWSSKEDRQRWETMFFTTFLASKLKVTNQYN